MKIIQAKDDNKRWYEILIDDEDYERCSQVSWCISRSMYSYKVIGSYKEDVIRIANFILGLPVGIIVDHIDCNQLNNLKINLRQCTQLENSRNRGPNAGRRYKGVYYRPNKKIPNWEASINYLGKNISLGMFKTPEEAAKVRDKASIRYHGEFAKLNFPNEIPVSKLQGSSSTDEKSTNTITSKGNKE